MSPADVYFAWMAPPAGGPPALAHRRAARGWEPPVALPGPSAAAALSAARGGADGRTNVTITRPLRTAAATDAQFAPGARAWRAAL
jgi:hypothetical protein